MSYGDGDYVITGDDVTSPALPSPTTVYVGDGSNDGFNYVVVSNILIHISRMPYRFILKKHCEFKLESNA